MFDHTGSTSSSGPVNKSDAKDAVKNHHAPQERNDDSTTRRVGFYQDTAGSEAEPGRGEQPEENSRSIWFGQLRQEKGNERSGSHNPLEEQHSRERVEETHRSPLVATKEEEHKTVDYLSTLPARQRQLYRRIQQQQREPASTHEGIDAANLKNSLDDKWYSSDEEENSESITDLLKSIKQKPEVQDLEELPAHRNGFVLSYWVDSSQETSMYSTVLQTQLNSNGLVLIVRFEESHPVSC